jgi:hypothetical protein
MLLSLIALALATATSVPVEGLPDMHIVSGATAVITDTGSGYTLSPQPSDKLSEGETEMLAQVLERPEQAMGPNSIVAHTDKEVAPIVPGSLRFSLIDHHGQMALIIRNGTNESYMYKAKLGRGSQSMTTDVCQIMPQARAFEHWPYRFDWIEITDLKVTPHTPGSPPRCE